MTELSEHRNVYNYRYTLQFNRADDRINVELISHPRQFLHKNNIQILNRMRNKKKHDHPRKEKKL